MDVTPIRRRLSDPLGLPLIAALIVVIFALDTITNLEIAVAVLYVAVILLSVRRFSSRGILVVAGVCGVATILSFVLTPRGAQASGLINSALSLVAIAPTTSLSITIQQTSQSERRARDDLAHAAQAASLGELAATIAHEINQPLGAVSAGASAAARWLDASPSNPDRAKEAVVAIIADANRAAEIVRRIRSLAAGTPAEREKLDLNTLVEDTVGLLRQELQRDHVVLKIELAEELPSVVGDKLQLQQVLLNLLTNARQAVVQALDGSRDVVVRTTRPSADFVVVAVQDSGAGVAAEISDKLFEAFSSSKVGGMGLGLAICRTLVEAHGGKIWLEPSRRGAIFKFALPIERQHLAPMQSGAASGQETRL